MIANQQGSRVPSRFLQRRAWPEFVLVAGSQSSSWSGVKLSQQAPPTVVDRGMSVCSVDKAKRAIAQSVIQSVKIDENALTASDAVELLSEVVAREEKEARVLKRP